MELATGFRDVDLVRRQRQLERVVDRQSNFRPVKHRSCSGGPNVTINAQGVVVAIHAMVSILAEKGGDRGAGNKAAVVSLRMT